MNLGVSRSGFYAWLRRGKTPRREADEHLRELIKGIQQEVKYWYGSPRMTQELRRRGRRIGDKRTRGALMLVAGVHYRTIWLEGRSMRMIDQTQLPFRFAIFDSRSRVETAGFIRDMVVHGAGAIGAAGDGIRGDAVPPNVVLVQQVISHQPGGSPRVPGTMPTHSRS